MGRITDEDIAKVRDATDVVQLISERMVLKPKGRLYWGLCPFHGEKTPSFKVDPSTQLWHCFGCGLGGDVYGWVMRTDNVEFPDAVRMLAERANIELVEAGEGMPRGHKERLFAVMAEAVAFYQRVLTGSREAGPSEARAYLAGRGFGSEVAKRWQLGFAPGHGALVRHLAEQGFSADEMVDANLALKADGGTLKDRFYGRIMFPIADIQGRPIAYGGRIVGKGEPKYLNTNDTPLFQKKANLYAIDRAKATITSTGTAIVVEGYTDVIALHEAGITNAVAVLGTALGPRHLKLLGRFAKRIVYLFDGDEAGMRAADRAAELIGEGQTAEAGVGRVDVEVAVIPDGLDPADYVGQRGVDAMRELVDGAQPLLGFAIDRRMARWDLERPEERARAMRDAAEVLAPVRGTQIAQDYAAHIAGRLFAKPEQVLAAIPAHAARLRVEAEDEGQTVETPQLAPPTSPQGRTEFDLLVLLVRMPMLRGRARELLAESLLSEPVHRQMAEAIVEAGSDESSAALIGRLDGKIAGAAAYLSASELAAEGEEQSEVLADGLTVRLKEFELERRIAVGRARLRQPESFKEPGEEDDVVKEVAELQRRLDALRRGNA